MAGTFSMLAFFADLNDSLQPRRRDGRQPTTKRAEGHNVNVVRVAEPDQAWLLQVGVELNLWGGG